MAHGTDQEIGGLGGNKRKSHGSDVDNPYALATETELDTTVDADIVTHAALTTGVHGVGASTVAKLSDVTDHTTDATAAHAASAVSVADAGLYTATTEVEAALQEVYSRLPYTIEQSTDIVIDSDSSGGGNGAGITPAATNLVAPVVANKKYLVEATVIVTQTAAGGVELSWTGPAAATFVWGGLVVQGDNNIVQDNPGVENAITDALNYAAAALTVDPIFIQGILTVDATAGNLTLLAAQDTAHPDNTTIHAESWLRVTPLQ